MLAFIGTVLIATSMSAVVSPGMAQASGYVEIVNRGSGKCMTIQNGSVSAGVVAARLDWARFGIGNRNINVLTSEKLTDMGNAATFYSVCVEVELFRA